MRARGLAVAAALTAAIAGGLGTTGTAHASSHGHNGVCEAAEVCMYWGSGLTGSYHDYYLQQPDFAGDRFLGPGSGQGEQVKNNSASASNRFVCNARVYYNENYSGPYDTVPSYGSANLVNAWNDNASFNWVC
ncbi:peptidase inhibitor family I36 protein [Streptomyces afghaniensis]|jgi:hypothetical protein|uniref:peptidase inhibitor family I36 protein n=1 Tax=Streptomyces afghaniensis TaxID=66865 RepID=UPI0033B0AAA7